MRQEAPQIRQKDTYRNAETVQMNGASSRVDKLIHAVAQVLVQFAGNFHGAGDVGQELISAASLTVSFLTVGHGLALPSFRPFAT
jgi:hypothetical protein